MKKIFLFFVLFSVLVSTLWVGINSVSAGGANVAFSVPGITNQEVKNARMYANSDYQNVYCALKEDDRVVCSIPGKYAGQTVQIYLGGRVFYASVPEPKPEIIISQESTSQQEQSLTCPDGEVPGAMVEFVYSGTGNTTTQFIMGNTLSEVEQTANSWLGHKFVSFTILSNLQCMNDK